MGAVGFCTTFSVGMVLWVTYQLAPHSTAAKHLSVIARLTDPRFPGMNPPVYQPSYSPV